MQFYFFYLQLFKILSRRCASKTLDWNLKSRERQHRSKDFIYTIIIYNCNFYIVTFQLHLLGKLNGSIIVMVTLNIMFSSLLPLVATNLFPSFGQFHFSQLFTIFDNFKEWLLILLSSKLTFLAVVNIDKQLYLQFYNFYLFFTLLDIC